MLSRLFPVLMTGLFDGVNCAGSVVPEIKVRLVGTNGTRKRGAGPTGKMKQLFEAASRLPRSQPQKITALLEPFIAHHDQR
jgi:hypothetical protein